MLDDRILIDAQQIIPLPEAADFQIELREKVRKERESRSSGMDLTRYNLQIGDTYYPNQWKRNAILLICKHLCEQGVSPDDIATLFDWRSNRVWYSVDGTCDAHAFTEKAREKALREGTSFDQRRWFCGGNDLCHFNQKTYAFSSQWGGESWYQAMTILRERFKRFSIDFSPVT
jgi:hypothetical protein